MYKQITLVFKAMIDALLGKVEDPQIMLEAAYVELQSDLASVRQTLAEKLATEVQLKRKIATSERSNAPASDLKTLQKQLEQMQAEIEKLRSKIADYESELRKAYMKKEVLKPWDIGAKVGKAIAEDGATWDFEIAPDPDLHEQAARELALQELGGANDASSRNQVIFILVIAVFIGLLAFLVSWGAP